MNYPLFPHMTRQGQPNEVVVVKYFCKYLATNGDNNRDMVNMLMTYNLTLFFVCFQVSLLGE